MSVDIEILQRLYADTQARLAEVTKERDSLRVVVPVSVTDACEVVAVLHEQLSDALGKLDPLVVENFRLERTLANCVTGMQHEADIDQAVHNTIEQIAAWLDNERASYIAEWEAWIMSTHGSRAMAVADAIGRIVGELRTGAWREKASEG